MFDFMKNIGSTEIIILVVILIIIFGARAMMGIGRKSGEAVKGFKQVKKEFTEALKEDDDKSSKT